METLETLPMELQHMIFSYLIRPLSSYPGDGMPRTRYEHSSLLRSTRDKDALKMHPYLNLAASSRQLRDTVEAFCHSLLVQHHSSTDKSVSQRKKVKKPYRAIWLQKCYKHCLFCGKSSTRRAVFNMLMWCCLKCDNLHYGKRIVCYPSCSLEASSQLTLRSPNQQRHPSIRSKKFISALHSSSFTPPTSSLLA
jgi:hypothetical protein